MYLSLSLSPTHIRPVEHMGWTAYLGLCVCRHRLHAAALRKECARALCFAVEVASFEPVESRQRPAPVPYPDFAMQLDGPTLPYTDRVEGVNQLV